MRGCSLNARCNETVPANFANSYAPLAIKLAYGICTPGSVSALENFKISQLINLEAHTRMVEFAGSGGICEGPARAAMCAVL